mmetsp:Transcript_71171/g.189799  ORF Transcript_71171/g.189799 Transcript_71171/m.189799 type:complete len:90 (-) Transcript_71171:40-309(-)
MLGMWALSSLVPCGARTNAQLSAVPAFNHGLFRRIGHKLCGTQLARASHRTHDPQQGRMFSGFCYSFAVAHFFCVSNCEAPTGVRRYFS